ncbi:MAG: acyl-CoA thioester hydrolase [Rhodothermales bacterium]|jgi:acyl-CoA thioester hydrolase
MGDYCVALRWTWIFWLVRALFAMTCSFVYPRRVEFVETDLAGIVHFSNFFRYMEQAEHAFIRSLGHSIHMQEGEQVIGWPRVHASADYRRPLRVEQEFEVQLLIKEIRTKSLRYAFRFRLKGNSDVLATGEIVSVCATYNEHEKRMKAVPIPEGIRSQISEASDAMLADGMG